METASPVPVYDIGVEGDHEFIANGVLVHNCYRESANPTDGWLSPEEIQRKRTEIPKHVWETEYDLQEPNFEGRAIDTAAVERTFDPKLGIFSGHDTVRIANPAPGALYVTGIDWAKEQDCTIIATFLATELPWTCVCWQKLHRLPWPVMVRKALAQWRYYPGPMIHDATGLGSVVEDIMREDLSPQEQRMVKGIILGYGRERQDLFSEYIGAIESDAVRYPRIDYAFGEHKYATVDDIYSPGRVNAHTPDSIVAGAFAWWARKRMIRPRFHMHMGGMKDSGWL